MDLRALDVPIHCRFRPMGEEVPVELALTLFAPADGTRTDYCGDVVFDIILTVRFPGWQVTLFANVYAKDLAVFADKLDILRTTSQGTATLYDWDFQSSISFRPDTEEGTVRVYIRYYNGLTDMSPDPEYADLFDGSWAVVVGVQGLVVDRADLSDIISRLRTQQQVSSWRPATKDERPRLAGWEQQPLE